MNQKNLSFCIIIPCFEEHAKKLDETLSLVSKSELAIIVVDDGSSEKYAEVIQETCSRHHTSLIKNKMNLGKGGAVKAGILQAHSLGYSHAIQLDSDGQHDTQHLQDFIDLSTKYPEALVSGRPIFDESVPKKRLYGRYLTHILVWIETLSFTIKDTMCGFRSYPVNATTKLLNSTSLGNHMDFDIEIMVKLYWSGMDVKTIPLKVLYPEAGRSYFYLFRDNWRITKMHTFLVLGMLLRVPRLIKRHFSENKWSEMKEKGSLWPMKLASKSYELLGYRFIRGLCYLISFYYYLLASNARSSSKQFQRVYRNYCIAKGVTPVSFSTYEHILSFAHMVVDKLAVLKGSITVDDFYPEDIDQFISLHQPGQGALFISSHFGNIEIIRGLGKKVSNIKYNSLIYTKNSKKIFAILKSFDSTVEDNIIAVEKVNPALGIQLDEKLDNGEWLFCMGDRLTAHSDKALTHKLLGQEVKIPQGPYVLSYILNTPKIYAIHCFREGRKFRIKIKDVTPSIEKQRVNRDLYINSVAKGYIEDLEKHLIKAPTQWFNFYKYWNQL